MQTLTRRPDWPEALAAYIAARRNTPFEYGVHDCARFVAGAIEAQTGENLMTGFRYKTAEGARAALKRAGGLLAGMKARLPMIPPAHAARGDVGLVDASGPCESDAAACVVLGDLLAVIGERGLQFIPRARLRVAFKV